MSTLGSLLLKVQAHSHHSLSSVGLSFFFYLVEVCVSGGGEVESRLPALVLQHVVEQLGGRPHVVAVETLGGVGGAVEQPHDGLGALGVHPRRVAPQVVVLEGFSRGGEGSERERVKAKES